MASSPAAATLPHEDDTTSTTTKAAPAEAPNDDGTRKRRRGNARRGHTADSTSSAWQRALDPSTLWDKAELHEVVFWVRQVLAVVCGLVWGLLPLTGYVGNLAYLALSGLGPFVFFAKYQRTVDPEWYWPLTQEGFLPAYALFLVAWIISYNTVHVG